MPEETSTGTVDGRGDLSTRLAADLVTLDRELQEIDLLVTQARGEAQRHEARRAAAATKLATAESSDDLHGRLDLAASLITLTQRAAVMEAQVDVLEGKRRTMVRYRDAVAAYADAVAGGGDGTSAGAGDVAAADAPMPAAVSRLLLTAQEDLRREIARAMHDGPAQSLTNIVLQAQIVERLVRKDPEMAAGEVRQLIAMVQQTLDATKSFIFDVRPMVLDDLGLVPTVRRATRERGERAGVAVTFDSMGQDRRLPADLESAMFRMVDEALAAYLSASPEQVTVRLDWGDQLEAVVTAAKTPVAIQRAPDSVAPTTADDARDLPPALAEMMEERRVDERRAVEDAAREAIVILPAETWREIQARAASVGVEAELLAGGGELRLVADLAAAADAGA